jgi:K+-transporting ATPase ATPase C chain
MRNRLPIWLCQHLAAMRALIVLTVILGVGYPLVVTAVAQVPGLQHRADGSLVHDDGRVVGSAVIGQAFTDSNGRPIKRYFQSRPSVAGAGYDPTETAGSNLGPEDILDTLSNPAVPGNTGASSLLTQVCSRSQRVGELEGVDGQRPYCTSTGIGAVLAVIHARGLTGRIVKVVSVNQECPAVPFLRNYRGVRVQCAEFGVDYRVGQIVAIRGPGKAWPANPVPPDAVTASGSGLDPNISIAYARLQARRVAIARDLPLDLVLRLVRNYTSQRTLGFMGEPAVNVLELNLALDRVTGG